MKTVRHFATLYYYDGPQIFEARDLIGGHYIAVMVESVDRKEEFLLAGVEPDRLQQFCSGSIDLRSLLVQRGETEWYLAAAHDDLRAPLELRPQSTPLAQSSYLPEPGFILHAQPNGVEALRHARIVLAGALERADLDSGAWRLATEEGDYSGKTKAGGPSLSGLILGSNYRFTCLEEIEPANGGRAERTLYLTEHQPA